MRGVGITGKTFEIERGREYFRQKDGIGTMGHEFGLTLFGQFLPRETTEHMLEIGDALPIRVMENFAKNGIVCDA